jgi:hypothetical protein
VHPCALPNLHPCRCIPAQYFVNHKVPFSAIEVSPGSLPGNTVRIDSQRALKDRTGQDRARPLFIADRKFKPPVSASGTICLSGLKSRK